MFEVGINKDYIKLLIDQTYGGEGAEYTGEKDLLEVTKYSQSLQEMKHLCPSQYTVGDVTIDNLSNDTSSDYGQVEVIKLTGKNCAKLKAPKGQKSVASSTFSLLRSV